MEILFLLQHVELLFNACISKYPKEIEMKFAYALFLIEKMNKKTSKWNNKKNWFLNSSLEHQFIIYKCNKIIEDDISNLNKDDLNLDIIKI